MATIKHWMTWQDGVDLVALTDPKLKSPNIIIHLANIVKTPVGNAPSGMILWQPDPNSMPAIIAFVSTDKDVGKYFGPKIFAGTPFEQVQVFKALINIQLHGNKAISRCEVNGYVFEVEMSGFSAPYLINRPPAANSPFWQQGIEMSSSTTVLKVNDRVIDMVVPPIGITGGPASVVAPHGLYAR
ncbi:MAG: hypothetical protein ABIR18_05900 [Chitinophagaceae bacterium]